MPSNKECPKCHKLLLSFDALRNMLICINPKCDFERPMVILRLEKGNQKLEKTYKIISASI